MNLKLLKCPASKVGEQQEAGSPRSWTCHLASAQRLARRIYEMYTVEGLSIGDIRRGSTPKLSQLAR
jgi:hypothetical protein